MKVSIITATYNSAETLPDTLASLQAQTYQNIEYIVIDGASRDGTLELVRACPRLTTLISEPDKGIYDALNKGIAQASGDIIGFLHSDDLFADSNSVEKLVSAFCAGEHNAIYADLDYVDKYDTSKIIRHWASGIFKSLKLHFGWMPPHPTFYMTKEMYERLGVFNLDYPIAADYDSILRYFNSDDVRVAYLPQVLIKMRIGGASNNSLLNLKKKMLEEVKVMRCNGIYAPLALPMKRLTKIQQYFS